MRFRPRKPGDDIARKLGAQRPEPRGELLRAIEEQIEMTPQRPRRYRPTRTVYALALTTAMMGLLASFGGLSYAATSVGDGAARAAKVVKVTIGLKATKPSASARTNSSADRSSGSRTICHVPPGNPGNAQTLTLSESGAKNHLKNHSLDYAGACQPPEPECDEDDPDDDQYCEEDDDDDDDDDDDNHNRAKR